jgi:hypothetical protein
MSTLAMVDGCCCDCFEPIAILFDGALWGMDRAERRKQGGANRAGLRAMLGNGWGRCFVLLTGLLVLRVAVAIAIMAA